MYTHIDTRTHRRAQTARYPKQSYQQSPGLWNISQMQTHILTKMWMQRCKSKRVKTLAKDLSAVLQYTRARGHTAMTGAAKLSHVRAYQHASLDYSVIYFSRQVRGHRVDQRGWLRDVVCIQIGVRCPKLPLNPIQTCDSVQTQKAQTAHKHSPFIGLAQSWDDADRSSWPWPQPSRCAQKKNTTLGNSNKAKLIYAYIS